MKHIIHVLLILVCVVALVSCKDKNSASNDMLEHWQVALQEEKELNDLIPEKAIPKAKADFESLSVEISGIRRWLQKARFKIMGDGLVEFSMNKSPNDAGRYRSIFNLKRGHLISLNKLLENTGWLTQPGANVEPGYFHASRIEMTISRQGIINKAWCHDRNPEPYGALVKFIEQIYRQEFLFNSLKSEDKQQRINASQKIFNELIARMGLKSHTPSLMLAEVDFTRYEEVFVRWLRNPTAYQQEELCVAIAWVGYLNRLDCYDYILELKDVYCRSDWDVVCETLLRLGGSRAVSALKDLVHVQSHRLDHVVSALIRSGPSGIRELMLILEEGQLPTERPQIWGDAAKQIQDRWTVAERVVRACMDEWDLPEFTVESKKQVAAKVEKLLASCIPGQWDAQRTEYFEKYLEMAN